MARSAKDIDSLTCLRCKHAIFGVELTHLVRLQNGVMHGTCHQEHVAIVERMTRDALAAGTHKETQLCPASPSSWARP